MFFVDFSKVGDVLESANYAYTVPALLLYVLALWFRTVRWRYLLTPLGYGETKRPLFPVVVVGYMANNLIPVRIGELMRAYYLTLREGISTFAAFGTVALERASDVIALLLLVAVAGVVGAIGVGSAVDTIAEDVPGGLLVLSLGALLPFIVVFGAVAFVVIVSPEQIRRILDLLLRPIGPPLRARVIDTAMNLIAGLTAVRTWKGLINVVALSLPVWIAEIGMYYVIALGFDIRSVFDSQLQFIAAIVAFGTAANLAGVLPSSAGSWGPFDFFGAVALTALGVDADVAAVYAVTVHVVLWGPVTLAGAVLLLIDKTSLANLAKGARASRSDADEDDSASQTPNERGAEINP